MRIANFLLFIFSFSTPLALAGSVVELRIPVVTSTTVKTTTGKLAKNQVVLVSSFNKELAAAGEKPFPDYATFGYYKKGDILVTDDEEIKTWHELVDRLGTVTVKLSDKNLDIGGSIPDDFTTSDHRAKVCYSGDPLKVKDLVAALADSVFSDQLTVFASKYKNNTTKTVDDEGIEWPVLWKEWKGTGEAVLLLTSIGDDGTDIETNLIYKCDPGASKGPAVNRRVIKKSK